MASPPIPPLLEHLAARPFSFYPPILNIEHNEWRYRKETWSEILVVNWKTGEEIWIPRRFIGEVSRIHDPVLIVGLTRELEYKAGAVWPYQRRILQMPVAAGVHPADRTRRRTRPRYPRARGRHPPGAQRPPHVQAGRRRPLRRHRPLRFRPQLQPPRRFSPPQHRFHRRRSGFPRPQRPRHLRRRGRQARPPRPRSLPGSSAPSITAPSPIPTAATPSS